MVSRLISRLVILLGGALYPAYCSYKTVKTKNVRDYVKWMMYWVVFAVFLCSEAIIDALFSFWLPFYYEVKILFVLWLLLPYTKGASYLYRRLIHPQLVKHESKIDDYFDKAKADGCRTFASLVSRVIASLKEAIVDAASHGQEQFIVQMRKTSLFNDVGDLDALVEEEESKSSAANQIATPSIRTDHQPNDSYFSASTHTSVSQNLSCKPSDQSDSRRIDHSTTIGYSPFTVDHAPSTRRHYQPDSAHRYSPVSGSSTTYRADPSRYHTLGGLSTRGPYLTRSTYGLR